MSTASYRPYNALGRDNSGVYPATMIGGGGAGTFSDDLDTTGFGFTQRHPAPDNRLSAADAQFAALPGIATSFSVRLRLKINNPSANIQVFVVDLAITESVLNVNYVGSLVTLPAVGETAWIELGPFTPNQGEGLPYTTGNFEPMTAGGWFVGVNDQTEPGGASTYDFEVYEVEVVATVISIGQLYTNLSTNPSSPNWVSACSQLPPTVGQTGTYEGYFNSSTTATPAWNPVHKQTVTAGAKRYYFVDDGMEFVGSYDKTTGQFKVVTVYDTNLPISVNNFGSLALHGDGNITSMLDFNRSATHPFGMKFNPDLDPATASVLRVDNRYTFAFYESRHTGGVYEPTTGLTWYYVFRNPNSSYDPPEYSWLGYDNTGALADMRGAYTGYGDALNTGWYGSIFNDGTTLYRSSDANTGLIQRFNLADNTWGSGNIYRPSGSSGGVVMVGLLPNGNLLAIDDRYESGDWWHLQLLVYDADSFVWTAGYYSAAWTPDSPIGTISLLPPGRTLANTTLCYNGSGTVTIRDNHAYYMTNALTWASDPTTGAMSGDVTTCWDLDLATGDITEVFSVPYVTIGQFGEIGYDKFDPSYYTTTSTYTFGMLLGERTINGNIMANVSTTATPDWWTCCSH